MDENILDMVENALGSLPEGASAAQAFDFLLFLCLYDVDADRAHWEYSNATAEQFPHKLAAFRKRLESGTFHQKLGDATRAFQAIMKAQTGHRSVPQTGADQTADWRAKPQTGRPILADRQTAQDVRLVVAVPDQTAAQTGRPANEIRALELLAVGKSNSEVLEILRSEGLKLDRNKLKPLREEAKATTT